MNRLNYLTGIVMALLCIAGAIGASAQSIIANGGTVTAQYVGNLPNEGIEKVVDGNVSTKYLTFNVAPLWIQWQCNTPQAAGVYTVVSANDAGERDPLNWTFEASDNGTDWTVLDTRVDQSFPSRLMTKTYFTSNTTSYTYYRLNISAINGGGLFQLADWGLYEATAPAAPTALNALSSGGNEVLLSWTDNTPVEAGFEVERSTDNATFTRIATVSPNVVQYLDADAEVNKQYYYRVRAVNPFGQSAYAVRTITTRALTGAFADLTDDGGTLEVSNENPNSAENSPFLIDNDFNTKYLIPGGFAGYSFTYHSTAGADKSVTKYTLVSGNDAPGRDMKAWVFEGSANGTSWTTLDTRTNELFPNRNQAREFRLANPAKYAHYRVTVTANNGSGIAGQISEWQIWGVDENAPVPPSGLMATAISKVEIKLDWTDNASGATNESGYEVARLGASGYTVIKNLPANTTTYTDNGLTPATRFFYRVRATSTKGPSAYSNTATDSTLYDPNLPLPPHNLVATVVSDTEVSLTWTDESDNETGFKVQRSKDGTVFSTVGTVGEGEVTYNDAAATLGTQYYYRILAFNTFGDALLYSNIADVITTGANEAPYMEDIDSVVTCNTKDSHTIALKGITPGVEAYQKLTLSVAITSLVDKDLFEQLTVTQPKDGLAELVYQLKEGASGKDTVTVTLQDDGGTLNGGADTYEVTFTIEAYQLDLFISSQTGTLVPRGGTTQLEASSSLAGHFSWLDGPGIIDGQDSRILTVRPTRGYEYTAVATTDEGCEKTATVTVLVEGNFGLDPGNILTPNGDGKNDTWVIWNIHTFPGAVVTVLDMSGREVYSKKDYTSDWDGTYKGQKLAEGAYYYIIDLGSGLGTMRGSLNILYEQ